MTSSPGYALPQCVSAALRGVIDAELLKEVRVHLDGGYAEAIGAKAFACGQDLYFARGEYSLATKAGRFLLGHELQHVAQQRMGRVSNPLGAGVALVHDPVLETEADRVGYILAEWGVVNAAHPTTLDSSLLYPRAAKAGTTQGAVIQALRIGWIPNQGWRTANIACHAEYLALANNSNYHHDVGDFLPAMKQDIYDENDNYFNANQANAGPGLPPTPFGSDVDTQELWRQQALTDIVLQVDHAIEYRHWGCNDFRNARILSQSDNLNPATARPGPAQRLVVSLDEVDDVNGSNVDVARGQILGVNDLNALLERAYQIGGYPPAHRSGYNPLVHAHNMANADFWAIYYNLEQEQW